MKWFKWTLISLVFTALTTPSALAVKTSYWTDNQSLAFKAGKTENVSISNFGRITLSPKATDLLSCRNDVSIVFDVRTLPDGSILAATGSEGQLLIYRDNKWTSLYKADQPYIFSMEIAPDGKIYLGAGGSKGEVIELSADGKESKILFSSSQAKYIWQLKFLPDGQLVAATGPNGKLYLMDLAKIASAAAAATPATTTTATTTSKEALPEGVQEIFAGKQKNLQALAVDKAGAIYVGTDGEAIVYKIEPKDGKFVSRAIYDAVEKEISVLAVDDKGYLYAATASGIQGKDMARSYLTKPQGSPVASMPVTKPTTTSAPATSQQACAIPADKTEKTNKNNPADKKTKKLKKSEKEIAADKKPSKTKEPVELAAKRPAMPRPPMPMPPMGGDMPSPPMMGQGNAVYRIDPLGFVTEIFRDKVDINAMILDDGVLYLATGPEGWLFKVTPATEEVILLAKTEAKNINDIARTSDGAFILSTASPAKVVKLGPGLAKTGTFTSKVFDARQIARWGKITVKTVDPSDSGCSAAVQTRSSEIKNPEDPGWSDWSAPADVKSPSQIASPLARYLQYKITFTVAEGKAPLLINEIQIAWMQDNLAPKIASVMVNTGSPMMNRPMPPTTGGGDDEDEGEMDSEGPAMPPMAAKKPGTREYQVTWKATDPNSDPLKYTIFLKQVNTPYWIEIQKDYALPMFKWDSQTVPDGRYEFKVVASDALANPVGFGLTAARVSDPFVVDNTPPAIRNLECTLLSAGKLLIKADLVDEQTEIQNGYVIINGSKDWQYIAPADELYDSKTEKIETVMDVPADNKPIMITLKVEDRNGNVSYDSKVVPAR
jgi:hypothetical protein